MSLKNKIKKIKKREGNIVPFEKDKITKAILKAGQSLKEFDIKQAKILSNKVVEMLNTLYADKKFPPRIEEIQDIAEIILMKYGFTRSAKAYIIYRQEHIKVREAKKELLSGRITKLPLSLNSLRVIAKRYLLKDKTEKEILETPEGMFDRVSKALALVEKKYKIPFHKIREWQKKFYEIMFNLEFLPAGRTLTNAGTKLPIISNCIVLHIEDSIAGIFNTLRDASLLQQSGSGLGFPFHLLRPSGTLTIRTKGVASGPISFLKVYNEAFGVIKQQSRHGANMAVMRVDHPDILDFIHLKEREGELRNFNISVSVTDKFMEQVKQKSKKLWICQFNNKKLKPKRIVRDNHGVILDIKEIDITAGGIMDEIIKAAWSNGEPGIIFIDEVNRANPLPGLGRIEACNPCGEQFLHDGDVCNLGSLNLDKFVIGNKINWIRLKEVVHLSIRMLDNVIDITKFPSERVNTVFRNNRRIGLGIMGFADMLFQLNVAYNSEQGRQIAAKIMKFIQNESHVISHQLAKEKGVFANYHLSVYKEKGIRMRNAALTTIAPTGSISMVTEVSSGLEPYFALAYVKEVMGGEKLYYTNRHLEKKLRKENLYSEELAQKISLKGTIQTIREIPDSIKKVFVGALDISVKDHIKMQAVFQKYIDNSISKTINFPYNAPISDVLNAYMLAWKLKCKSCTVYRSSSREKEVLTLASKKDKQIISSPILDIINPSAKICPECRGRLVSQEGCLSCLACGFGLCSI